MVQLEKVHGEKGRITCFEDGTIVSSSGELASSEGTAQQLIGLIQHTLPVNFGATINANPGQGEGPSGAGDHDQGQGQGPSSTNANGQINGDANSDSSSQVWKWSKITVDFGDHSYVACLSNKRVHLVKRGHDHSSDGS